MHTGIVRIHAVTIVPATFQRTFDDRHDAPTPRIADEITCVVESGKPSREATSITAPADVSAAKPWIGLSSVSRVPIFLMIRQPPAAVPQAIAPPESTITQSGTSKVSSL